MQYQMLQHHLYCNENLYRKRQCDMCWRLNKMMTDSFGTWIVKIVGKTIRSNYNCVFGFSQNYAFTV